MVLTALALQNFRNYDALDFHPHESLSILRGQNAQGKTNLLEAIYLLSTTRPLRASRESEVIRWGEKNALVSGSVRRENELEFTLEIALSTSERKQAKINGVTHPRALDLLGHLNSVIFSAQDLSIVRGDPADRRRFLDLEIAQLKPKYAHAYARYKKTLEQRNELLKRHAERRGTLATLDAWDEQMIAHGAQIMKMRADFVQKLAPLAADAHHKLTDGKESLIAAYLPNVECPDENTEPAWKECFETTLMLRRDDEIRRGSTLVGPRRDDLGLLIDRKEARLYGSQGQQRTAVLSLKLAEAQLAQEEVGESPVVLLDDVMSDLDDARKAKVMSFLIGKAQVFITCTDLHAFPKSMLKNAAIFSVENGKLEEGKGVQK